MVDDARDVVVAGPGAEERHVVVGMGVLARDGAQHLRALRRRGPDVPHHVAVPHQCPPAPPAVLRYSSYLAAVMRASSSLGSAMVMTISQPAPYGSWLTCSGRSVRPWFTSLTSPDSGAKRSETALTDSTTPKLCIWRTRVPTFGSSTNTTSPSWSWAYSVIPTRASVPSTRAHSCSRVYRRSTGYDAIQPLRLRSLH